MRSEGYCTWVCVSVCLSHLTFGASVRPENAVTYSAGNEGKNICGDLPETTAFKSYAAKHERRSQYACAARVTVVGSVCLSVCPLLSICLHE